MRSKIIAGLMACMPLLGQAAELEGSRLSVWWSLPFAGLLLSIALGPLLRPAFWHRHDGKIVFAWALAFVLPCLHWFGATATLGALVHALTAEYLPFILLLTALFVVAGGIHLAGTLQGAPGPNTRFLLLGTLLASIMGTTGASMLLIRPLIRANRHRRHQVHIIVFFIFLVANVGGSLTPLGDPPLFLGFLKGVDFFWTARNIFPETLFLSGALLFIFYFLDRRLYARHDQPAFALPVTPITPIIGKLRIEGKINFFLLAAIIGAVLMSGLWQSDIVLLVAGSELALPSLLRDLLLIGITLASLALTPRHVRRSNDFSWAPMQEVARLFAGIFITIVPVIAMLRAGEAGVFGWVLRALTDSDGQPNNLMYFWATGLLSAFLDNAPTYLVFFNSTGGEAQLLMTRFAGTLAAISCGAVFMGALSYIGNAPNLMVKAIAEQQGVPMPSFFGYMAWSCGILLPLFLLMSLLFFR